MTSHYDVSCNTPAYDTRGAYFEAGHAVIAWLEGLEIVMVSIQDDSCWIDINEPELNYGSAHLSTAIKTSAQSIIRGLLAGPAALRRHRFGSCTAEFNLADEELICEQTAWRAISMAGALGAGDTAVIPQLWKGVVALIHAPEIWTAIDGVAGALLQNGELAGCEVEEIAKHAILSYRKSIRER